MDFLSYFLFFSLICISIQAFHSFARRTKNLPPGPKPYPIIGNLLELGDKPHKSLANLSKTYGPIMSLKLGQVTTIVVSSSAMAKEILQTHDQSFCNRTVPDALQACRQGEFALPWIPATPRWRNLRKICNSHLFSGKILDASEELRCEKVKDLLDEVHRSMLKGEAIDFGKVGFITNLNLLSTSIFSLDLARDPSSSSARELKETVWGIMEEIGRPNIADYFPLLKKIDPQGIRRRSTVYFGKMIDLFDRIITERLFIRKELRGSLTANRDLLDILINVSEENSDEMDKTKMERLFVDLFVAATETTSTTLQWSMTELLKNPKILLKAQEELRKVIGQGNHVKESDTTRLPYLQAIVKETFRLHPAAPLLIPRKAERDVEVHSFIVPKGSQVLVNVWAVGRDSSIFDNPNKFMPERFLNSKIDVRGRDFELVPFGGGRRICPGLPLAMRMLPFMLGSLIHSFDWKLEDGVSPETMNMEDKFGLTLQMIQPLRAIPTPITA